LVVLSVVLCVYVHDDSCIIISTCHSLGGDMDSYERLLIVLVVIVVAVINTEEYNKTYKISTSFTYNIVSEYNNIILCTTLRIATYEPSTTSLLCNRHQSRLTHCIA